MTWFEKFSSLWALLELDCKGCKHPWTIILKPFAVVAILAAFGFLPVAFVQGAFGEGPRWYKPLILLVAVLFALPFLAFGVLAAALAMCVKFVIVLFSFAWKCPECGRRKWQVARIGVADFLSSF